MLCGLLRERANSFPRGSVSKVATACSDNQDALAMSVDECKGWLSFGIAGLELGSYTLTELLDSIPIGKGPNEKDILKAGRRRKGAPPSGITVNVDVGG